jgi:hypothetical protein
MKQRSFGYTLSRILGPVRRRRVHKHDPLLISSLTKFNFRPPLFLVFPGELLDKNGRARQASFHLLKFFEILASELGKYGVEPQTKRDIYGKSESEKFRIES